MSAGIGVDMLEIARMERVMRRRPSFLARVFTDEERAYCDGRARPAEHYAARWAAREAVLKALGTGFSGGIGFKDVSVRNDDSGRPQAVLAGRALEVAQAQGVREVAISLSHTREVAVANAVMVTDEVRPKVEERPDPAQDLLQSFRQARVVIDELERQQLSLFPVRDEDEDRPVEGEGPVDGDDGSVPVDEGGPVTPHGEVGDEDGDGPVESDAPAAGDASAPDGGPAPDRDGHMPTGEAHLPAHGEREEDASADDVRG